MSRFDDYFWPDSNIESITIEYDKIVLMIYNASTNKKLAIVCTGLAGITNLCIWDDTVIFDVNLQLADEDDQFVRQLRSAYSCDIETGINRRLRNGLITLSIELSNHIVFAIYCLSVEVEER